MLGSTSYPTLSVSFPNVQSISKSCILLCLHLADHGNLPPWIIWSASILTSMDTTMFLWLSTNSLRWPFRWLGRRVSEQKALPNPFLNKYGCTSGSHIPSSKIGITRSYVHFGQRSSHCSITISLIPQRSTLKLMDKPTFSTEWFFTSYIYTIHAHGMKYSPMSNTHTTRISITRLFVKHLR